ncbi:UPF0182 family protein [Ammonicoccus fulvus]|uniref:UPF0182 protein AADG42_08260 n=1 Tax=Ammonicoccus fulvus TaxID=3138240 RepID=A0ABZ3FML7_9ACTN
MSATTRIPSESQPRRRSALLPTLVVVSGIVLLFILFTNIWTDRLWFVALDYERVFTVQFLTRVVLFLVVGLVMALGIVGNTALAYRLRPPTRPGPLASELLERYRDALESRFVQIMIGLGVVVALFAGVSGASQVQTYLAWVNRTPFGVADPRFGFDVAFYVFELPWWRWIVAMLTALLVFSTLAAGIVHYVMGALRVAKGERRQTSRAAQAHLSILIGLTVLMFAVSAWLDRYAYQTTTNQLLTGLSYTDDHARVTASLVVAIITAICALLFISNIFIRRWMIPVAALVLAVVSSVLLTMIYPAGVQAIEVNPNEPDKERPYIESHIAATRAAYGIDDVEITNYSAEQRATAGQLRADAQALPGIRLIDPAVVAPTFDQLQQVRGFYSFPSVLDVDRYVVEGQETDAVVAVRELDISGLQDRSWNNLRTVYTHGYGLVASYGNRRQPGGEPEWLVRDIPPVGALAEHQPRIYFGEQHTEYSIVGAPAGTPPVELDTPGGGDGGGERRNTYTGEGGVEIGNWFNRLLYATRMADVNILLSGRVNEASKIIYDRTPRQRVQAAAPWLTADSNAYPALVEGRVVWIVDAYTTTNSYPNSHRISLDQATSDTQTRTPTAQPETRINYIRNSVKAVVDAYDGSVTLYAWDEQDPLLQTWRKAFPDTVKDRSEISPALLEHLRYPDDLFKVQRDVLGRYHVTDPMAWFQQNDLWVIPNDPVAQNNQKENPYLLSIKWPGDNQALFSQTTVFVPRGRNNLAAFMAVNADAASPEYGRMRILRMSDSQQVDGPNQSFNAMVTDEQVANRLRPFLNQGSAQVVYGNLLTLPLGGGLLYAQPIYTQKAAGQGSYPALTFVTVRFGERVGIGDTLQEALNQVFGGDAGASTGEEVQGETVEAGTTPPEQGGEPRPADNPGAVRALNEASTAFNEAQTALQNGDLGLYQRKIEEARAAMQRAQGALGG